MPPTTLTKDVLSMESNQIKYYLNTYSKIAQRSKEIADQMNDLLAIKSKEEGIDVEMVELIESDLFTLLQAQHYNMKTLEGMMLNRKEAVEINQGISSAMISFASLDGMTMPEIQMISAGSVEQIEPYNEPVADSVDLTPEEEKEDTMESLLAEEERNMPKEEAPSYPMKDGERVFRFTRRLVGGYVEMPGMETNVDNSENYYVPEKMVVDMTVEDGDYLKVKSKYVKEGQVRYNFEIAERNTDQSSNRMSYEYCHVREDVSPIAPSSFYVDRSYTQGAFVGIKNNSYVEIERLYLNENDIEYRNIQEDDIIKIVYWLNSPQETVRVVEVADLPGGDGSRPKPEPKPTKKETPKKDLPEVDMSLYPEINGKNIVIVGFEPFHARYESLLSRHGAIPTLYTGDESIGSVASTIEEADLVIFVIEMMSHNAYDAFKEYSKSKNVRHVLATKSGANFLAHLANMTLSEVHA